MLATPLQTTRITCPSIRRDGRESDLRFFRRSTLSYPMFILKNVSVVIFSILLRQISLQLLCLPYPQAVLDFCVDVVTGINRELQRNSYREADVFVWAQAATRRVAALYSDWYDRISAK